MTAHLRRRRPEVGDSELIQLARSIERRGHGVAHISVVAVVLPRPAPAPSALPRHQLGLISRPTQLGVAAAAAAPAVALTLELEAGKTNDVPQLIRSRGGAPLRPPAQPAGGDVGPPREPSGGRGGKTN
ncbi:hypothetical protein ABZP36_025903 [Zizania latifolia]